MRFYGGLVFVVHLTWIQSQQTPEPSSDLIAFAGKFYEVYSTRSGVDQLSCITYQFSVVNSSTLRVVRSGLTKSGAPVTNVGLIHASPALWTVTWGTKPPITLVVQNLGAATPGQRYDFLLLREGLLDINILVRNLGDTSRVGSVLGINVTDSRLQAVNQTCNPNNASIVLSTTTPLTTTTPSSTQASTSRIHEAPRTTDAYRPVQPVSSLNMDQFIGLWYQMMTNKNTETELEKSWRSGYAVCLTLTLCTVGPDTTSLLYRQLQNPQDTRPETVTGAAKLTNQTGVLSVRLPGMTDDFPHIVIALGPVDDNNQYSYAVVTDDAKGLLFVLARNVKDFQLLYLIEVLQFLDLQGFDNPGKNPVIVYQDSSCFYPLTPRPPKFPGLGCVPYRSNVSANFLISMVIIGVVVGLFGAIFSRYFINRSRRGCGIAQSSQSSQSLRQ